MSYDSDKRVLMSEAPNRELKPIDEVPGFEGIEGGKGVYAALLGDPESGPWFYVFRHDANVEVPRHSHASNTMHYITKGEWRLGNRVFGPGFWQYERQGMYYGPIISGPEGSEFLAIYDARPGFLVESEDGSPTDMSSSGQSS